MDISYAVAKARLNIFSNLLSIVNVANQLHLISDNKAEKLNKINLAESFDALERLGYSLPTCCKDFIKENRGG